LKNLLKVCVKFKTPFSKVCQNHTYFPQEKRLRPLPEKCCFSPELFSFIHPLFIHPYFDTLRLLLNGTPKHRI
jgi:hypothetical protein